MNGKVISLIYFYIISAASLALVVIGIFNIVNFIINSTQYDKYPTRYGPPRSCEVYPMPYRGAVVSIPGGPDPEVTPSAEELEIQKQNCLKNEEIDRKQYRIDDMKNAITFTTVGLVLFLIHFLMARKQSRS